MDSFPGVMYHADAESKWPNVQVVSEDASLLDTSSPSPTPAPEDWKIPLDRLDLIGQRTAAMELHLIEIRGMLQTIIKALAEDQDPDEMPAQYLDGSPIR